MKNWDPSSVETVLWLELELGRERRFWCPLRSEDDDPEDPDRLVNIEDIAPFLFTFSEPQMLPKLLLCMLDFLGLRFWQSHFECGILETQTHRDYLGLTYTETLTTEIEWSSAVQKIKPSFLEDNSFQEFCRSFFSQTVHVLKEPLKTQMILLWLKFEEKVFQGTSFPNDGNKTKKAKVKELKQLVQGLLQNDQRNIAIYIGFAQLEQVISGPKACWKVLEAAMAFSRGPSQPSLFTSAAAASVSSGSLQRRQL